MTTEEKAKAYDEALERLKPLYEQAKKDDNPIWSTYEYLVPELKESDDERIRKWIIEEFKIHYDFESPSLNPMVEKAMDWLEKQKEQKHPNGCFTCDEYKKGYEEGRRNGFTAGYNKAMKEVEQKEQNPVEIKIDNPNVQKIELLQKSWYTEGYYDREFNNEPRWVIKTGEGGPRYEENPKYGQHIEYKPVERSLEDDHIIGFVYDLLNEIEWKDDWAMSKEECLRLLSNYRPQKPSEWSEEDKEYLASCIDVIDNFYALSGELKTLTKINVLRKEYAEKLKSWLKSIHPQPKQEWSEEDEETRKDIIAGLEATKQMLYRADASGQACYNRWIDWLKSLRPQPKRDGLDDYMKGYSKGYADAEKEYNERTSYHIDVPNNWPPKMPDLPTQTTTNDIQSNAIPHWKPSEEQMGALNEMILTGGLSYVGQEGVLISLRNDLKRL